MSLAVSYSVNKKSSECFHPIWSGMGKMSIIFGTFCMVVYKKSSIIIFLVPLASRIYIRFPTWKIWSFIIFGACKIFCIGLGRTDPILSIAYSCDIVVVLSLTYGIVLVPIFRLKERSRMSLCFRILFSILSSGLILNLRNYFRISFIYYHLISYTIPIIYLSL